MSNVMHVEVDVVGAVTKQKYIGQFEVQLFLNHKQRAQAAREANKNTAGLMRTPRWDMQGFIAGLKDQWPNIAEADKLNLTEAQYNRIMAITAISAPIGDPEADILGVIAVLNAHIVTAPDWWGRTADSPGGYELIDYEPVLALNKELQKLQEAYVKGE